MSGFDRWPGNQQTDTFPRPYRRNPGGLAGSRTYDRWPDVDAPDGPSVTGEILLITGTDQLLINATDSLEIN